MMSSATTIVLLAFTVFAVTAFQLPSAFGASQEKAKCIMNFDLLKNFTDCFKQVTGREYEVDQDDAGLQDADKLAIFECSDKRAGIMDDSGHFYEEKALKMLEAHGYFEADDNVIQEVKEGIHECYQKFGDDDHLGFYKCLDDLLDEVCDLII